MKASMGYLFRLEIKIDLKCFYVESMSKRLYFTTSIDFCEIWRLWSKVKSVTSNKKNRIE